MTKKEIVAEILKREMATPAYRESRDAFDCANASIISDLRANGIMVNRLDELQASHALMKSAIPVLAKWVPQTEDRKEMLVRMLSVPAARGRIGDVFFEEFDTIADSESQLKWAIGNALSITSTASDVPKLLAIAAAKQNGKSRQMVVLGLKRFNLPEVRKLLIELLNDDDVVAHAASALGNLRAVEAVPQLTSLLSDSRTLVRHNAKEALKKIK